MHKFRLFDGKIKKFKVISETNERIEVQFGGGSILNEYKKGIYHEWFDTFEEAKKSLVEKITERKLFLRNKKKYMSNELLRVFIEQTECSGELAKCSYELKNALRLTEEECS